VRHEREPSVYRWLRSALLPLMLVLCGAGSSRRAPSLQVSQVQDLTFGNVLAGVVTTIQLTDASAGQYTLTNGTGKPIQAQLIFVLPPTLTTAGGASVPVTFGPVSAGFSPDGSLATVVPFDPSVPFTVTVDRKTTARVFLGGTLQPGSSQSPGSYSATIVLTAN